MNELKLWDTPNLIVDKVYNTANYEVIDYNNSKVCYIFFSSHGLFFPNTIEEFQNKIVEENRYEWKHMASNKEVIAKSGRHIFVRDIYKQWYIKGINNEINSIEKLVLFLEELTKGYDIITVGSSAGGYAAALIAAKLSAKYCFDFSGQVSIWEVAEENPFAKQGIGCEAVQKYYDIAKIIGESKCRYYYFYPAYNERDVKQYLLIRKYQNVEGFAFEEKNHAATMFAGNMRYIIYKDSQYMDMLYEYYGERKINKINFLFKTVSVTKALWILIKEIKYYVLRKIDQIDKRRSS